MLPPTGVRLQPDGGEGGPVSRERGERYEGDRSALPRGDGGEAAVAPPRHPAGEGGTGGRRLHRSAGQSALSVVDRSIGVARCKIIVINHRLIESIHDMYYTIL